MLYVINKKRANKQKKGNVLILCNGLIFGENNSYDIYDFYLIYIKDEVINLNIGDSITSIDSIQYDTKLVGECSVQKHDKHDNDSSFIINDAKIIMDDVDGSKYFNRYTYYELYKLYIYQEFRNQYYGTYFVRNICEYINEYNNGLIYGNNVIVTKAGALIKEYPEEPSEEELNIIINKVTKFYESCGFVSTNDFNNFDTSNGLMYVNNITAIPLINFYKKLYNDKNSILKSN